MRSLPLYRLRARGPPDPRLGLADRAPCDGSLREARSERPAGMIVLPGTKFQPGPGRDPPALPATTLAAPRLAEHLVETIVSAAEGVRKAKNVTPPLALKSLAVEIGFVVEHSTQADGGIQILPVSAHLGGDLARKAIHRIEVVFEGRGK